MTDSSHEAPDTYAYSGALLAVGSILLFIGTLFYIRLTPELGLPTAAANRMPALSDALALGPRPMLLAGGFAFFGDIFLTAGAIALMTRRKLMDSDLERFGWTLFAMGAGIAIIFDSLMAAAFSPLAQSSHPGAFVALKSWFDLLFASGNVPYGIGAVAVLVADMRAERPLLPRALAVFGIAVGVVAVVSGAAYVGGILVLPAAIGLSVTFGCVVFAVFGVQIVRREGRRALRAHTAPRLATSAVASVRS